MCVYMAIFYVFSIILQVMLWCMDSAAALKCNGCGLESLLAGHLDKGSVQWWGVLAGGASFLIHH